MGRLNPQTGIDLPVICNNCSCVMEYHRIVRRFRFMPEQRFFLKAGYLCHCCEHSKTVACNQKWASEQWYNEHPDSELAASESEE